MSECTTDDKIALDANKKFETDEHLRAFIVRHYASAGAHEIDGRILVENMEHLFQWMRNGKVPSTKKLRTVKTAE